ncbi:hypothetical protein ACH427_31720 [Streptomyces sp. NPDC020379]
MGVLAAADRHGVPTIAIWGSHALPTEARRPGFRAVHAPSPT